MRIIKLNMFFFASLMAIFYFLNLQPAFAAVMNFNPTSGSYSVGQNFTVGVAVDTENENTTSADAVINYDSSILTVASVSYGSFYPTVLHSDSSGVLSISGLVSNPGEVINGSGTLATITFNSLTSGTASVSFDCTDGQTNDSNVSKNDLDSTDIINCSALQAASFTIGGAEGATPTGESGVTSTPTPTGESGVTSTPTPTSIPAAGLLDIVSLSPKIIMAFVFLLIGIIPLLI